MKARQVLIFLLSDFAALGVLWLVMPADGIAAGPLTLRFSNMQATLRDANETKVDVDSVLNAVQARFKMKQDTLEYYRQFFTENPDRIYLPGDDIDFFRPVFKDFEKKGLSRVVHYGDSQIELDRISQDLRQDLQARFGGNGTGLFPDLSNVP